MLKTAEVVVIGAGIQGLSSAYHLSKKGVKDIVVLEKEFVGAGSTSRSCSMLMLQRENTPKILLSQYSYKQYFNFESELGVNPRFKKTGFLSVATEKKATEVVKMAKLRQKMGVKTEILDPKDINSLVPVVNTSDIVIGVLGLDDGTIDVTAIMNGYKEGAERNGVKIYQGKEFETIGIRLKNDRIVGVDTRSGFISTNCIINAAGADAQDVSKWVDLSLPIMNRRRNIFITEPFDGVPDDTPLVEDAELEFYYRKEGSGVLIGMGKEEESSISMSLNTNFLPKIVDFALHRVPILADAQIDLRKGWSGIRPLTPDICPIIGPVEAIEGYYLNCGWGGEGIMHAPAGGQLISEYVCDGMAKSLDGAPFLPSRFIG